MHILRGQDAIVCYDMSVYGPTYMETWAARYDVTYNTRGDFCFMQ
jgi:hypothetical protein